MQCSTFRPTAQERCEPPCQSIVHSQRLHGQLRSKVTDLYFAARRRATLSLSYLLRPRSRRRSRSLSSLTPSEVQRSAWRRRRTRAFIQKNSRGSDQAASSLIGPPTRIRAMRELEITYITGSDRQPHCRCSSKPIVPSAGAIDVLNDILTTVDDVPRFWMIFSQKILARIAKKLFYAL
jgi:hypothetical protein